MTTRTLADHIRPLKLARAQRRRTRRGADLTGRALAAIQHRENVEQLLQPYLDTLRDAIPELWPRRRLFDGCWVLGLEADLPCGTYKGRPYRAYSRLEYAIRIDLANDEFSVKCSTTVFDRDAESDVFEGSLSSLDEDALSIFIEHHCLLFATRFFKQAPRRREAADAA